MSSTAQKPNRGSHPNGHLQTPIKKNKLRQAGHTKTAESPNMCSSESKQSLAEIEAQELFDNFNAIVNIEEVVGESNAFEGSPYKKLDYVGATNHQIVFEGFSSSKRKYATNEQRKENFIKIKPFVLVSGAKQEKQCKNLKTTPSKKSAVEEEFIQRTAKKEEPFRQIHNQRKYF